jgi:hypothetical protein
MADQCGTCFYGRTFRGALTCMKLSPSSVANESRFDVVLPPRVDPDQWCGEFSATDPHIYAPGFAVGSVTVPAADTATEVLDSNVTSNSKIFLQKSGTPNSYATDYFVDQIAAGLRFKVCRIAPAAGIEVLNYIIVG